MLSTDIVGGLGLVGLFFLLALSLQVVVVDFLLLLLSLVLIRSSCSVDNCMMLRASLATALIN